MLVKIKSRYNIDLYKDPKQTLPGQTYVVGWNYLPQNISHTKEIIRSLNVSLNRSEKTIPTMQQLLQLKAASVTGAQLKTQGRASIAALSSEMPPFPKFCLLPLGSFPRSKRE